MVAPYHVTWDLEGLENATAAQAGEIELLGGGTGLHWAQLDVDHYVPGLLNNIFGTAAWMRHVGRLGGSARSHAKTAAARANGAKAAAQKQPGNRSKNREPSCAPRAPELIASC